tara:strand:- start:2468 stop:3520 length:1053 start_codon:yes stop_codon:yes gene_type:complete
MVLANRYVSIEKEATFGTEPSGTQRFGEVEEESFQESFDLLKRVDMNRAGSAKATDAKHYAEGSLSMPLQPDMFTMACLHGVYGSHVPGGTPGVADKFADSVMTHASVPSYTFRVGRDDNEYTYTGQVIESVSISASVGEYAMISFSTTGCKSLTTASSGAAIALGALGTPSYDYTGDAAHFVGCYVNFEDLATSSAYSKLVQSIDFEITTSRDMDNSYGLGSDTCIRKPPMTLREITGNITFHKATLSGDVAVDEPHFTELLAGHLNAGDAVNPAISILFQVDALNKILFSFYKVHYEAPQTSVSGRDSQTMTVAFHALFDDNNNGMSEVLFSSESTGLKGGAAVDLDA